MNTEQLVIEKHCLDGSKEAVARWTNTPRGWDILTRRAAVLRAQDVGALNYIVRVARPSDNVADVPTVNVMATLRR